MTTQEATILWLQDILREFQWSKWDGRYMRCPKCERTAEEKHADECVIGRALSIVV